MLVNFVDRVSCKVTIESFTDVILSEFQSVVINFVAKLHSMSSNSNHSPRFTTTRITKDNTKISRTETALNTIVKNTPRTRNSRTVINSIPCFNIFIIFMSYIFIHTCFHSFLNHISNTIEVTFF